MSRLARLSLTTTDAPALIDFYIRAFDFRVIGARRRQGEAFERLMEVRGGAMITTLALGREVIEIVQFETPGAPYPPDASACDTIFQHFAIVVADMEAAYRRLASLAHWRPISTGGPVRLPQSSGGVTAFKFRDPEGHPLEFLAFPEAGAPARWKTAAGSGPCLGIDHTAISVGDEGASLAFYQGLGLHRSGGSLNNGPEQDALDGLRDVRVDVTALSVDEATPNVELLAYGRPSPPRARLASNDIAATRLIFELSPETVTGGAPEQSLRDPDGRHLFLEIPPVRETAA